MPSSTMAGVKKSAIIVLVLVLTQHHVERSLSIKRAPPTFFSGMTSKDPDSLPLFEKNLIIFTVMKELYHPTENIQSLFLQIS